MGLDPVEIFSDGRGHFHCFPPLVTDLRLMEFLGEQYFQGAFGARVEGGKGIPALLAEIPSICRDFAQDTTPRH